MSFSAFLLRLGCALACGMVIGVERQWRQRTAGLRTYTLVSAGSALFVLIAALTGDGAAALHIAGQEVTGVGFLGAGVIMRSGMSVHGLNTASALWCSSAVGTLAGLGYFLEAAAGALLILAINTLLRPVVALINRQPSDMQEQAFRYAIHLTCQDRGEMQLRTLLVQLTTGSSLTIHEVESAAAGSGKHSVLKALLSSPDRADAQVEQVAGRLLLEKNVMGLTWQLLPSGRSE